MACYHPSEAFSHMWSVHSSFQFLEVAPVKSYFLVFSFRVKKSNQNRNLKGLKRPKIYTHSWDRLEK